MNIVWNLGFLGMIGLIYLASGIEKIGVLEYFSFLFVAFVLVFLELLGNKDKKQILLDHKDNNKESHATYYTKKPGKKV